MVCRSSNISLLHKLSVVLWRLGEKVYDLYVLVLADPDEGTLAEKMVKKANDIK